MRYRRSTAAGATYFFTVNLAQRNEDFYIDKGIVTKDWGGGGDETVGVYGER